MILREARRRGKKTIDNRPIDFLYLILLCNFEEIYLWKCLVFRNRSVGLMGNCRLLEIMVCAKYRLTSAAGCQGANDVAKFMDNNFQFRASCIT